MEWHVTSIRNGSVYGHSTDYCDPCGCSGKEQYICEQEPSIEEGEGIETHVCHGCGDHYLEHTMTKLDDGWYCEGCNAATREE